MSAGRIARGLTLANLVWKWQALLKFRAGIGMVDHEAQHRLANIAAGCGGVRMVPVEAVVMMALHEWRDVFESATECAEQRARCVECIRCRMRAKKRSLQIQDICPVEFTTAAEQADFSFWGLV